MTLRARQSLAREGAVAHIPYSVLASPSVVLTKRGDLLQVFELRGLSFETVGSATVNAWHERLCTVLRNLASPGVALWTHLVRAPCRLVAVDTGAAEFGARLARAYSERLTASTLYANTQYLSVVFRPTFATQGSGVARWFSRDGRRAETSLAENLDACHKLRTLTLASLESFGARALDLSVRPDGRLESETLGFLAQLLNAEQESVPLPRGPLDQHLLMRRLLVGSETLEYRSLAQTRYGAFLGLKEYPTPTWPGMLDALLSLPLSLVLTQSFAFLSRSTAQGVLQRQYNRMRNAADLANSQTQALTQALDELSSNEFALGDHHWSLQVLSPSTSEAITPSAALVRLQDDLATVRGVLADCSILSVREDLALEAAYWAQQPGQFALRPRTAPISTRNFAALAPWHAHPQGLADGNHWGRSMAVLRTSAGGPYHFSLHAAAGPGRALPGDVGHTFLCGPSGSGKTVFVGFVLTLLHGRGVAQVALDKDRGLEILIRALDGIYLSLRSGTPTGLNPLQLEATADNIEFLNQWLRRLLTDGERPLSPRECLDLDQALRGVLALDRAERRLSRLIEYLDPTDADGPYVRLSAWCERTQGERAWAFDCPTDEVAPRLSQSPLIGIDVTEFLEHDLVRAPLTLYLLHLIRSLLSGKPFVCWMDEFGRLLADETFRRFSQEGPNTWRKLNGVMCLATQGARDVLASPISRSIVEQTPTKIFFPNPQADRADHIDGLGLTEREYELVSRELPAGSRQFLVKQSGVSVVCELDLTGLTAELAVISGRRESLDQVERLRQSLGGEASAWLDTFMKRDTTK